MPVWRLIVDHNFVTADTFAHTGDAARGALSFFLNAMSLTDGRLYGIQKRKKFFFALGIN